MSIELYPEREQSKILFLVQQLVSRNSLAQKCKTIHMPAILTATVISGLLQKL